MSEGLQESSTSDGNRAMRVGGKGGAWHPVGDIGLTAPIPIFVFWFRNVGASRTGNW